MRGQSSNGVQIGDLVSIEKYDDLEQVKKEWSGKLKRKNNIDGAAPKQNMLFEPLTKRFTGNKLRG
jgi:hypothetical protein